MLLLSHQVSACSAAGGQLVWAVQGAGGAVGGLTIEVWMAVCFADLFSFKSMAIGERRVLKSVILKL